MGESIIQKQVLEEIKRIPENKLAELYNLLHAFRLGIQSPMDSSEQIMQFAGSWNDMPDEVFNDFMGNFNSGDTIQNSGGWEGEPFA